MSSSSPILSASSASHQREWQGPRLQRVAHITHGLDVGGAEKLLLDFARFTDADQFDVCFISLGQDGPIGGELRELQRPVFVLDQPSGVRPQLVGRLAALLRRECMDIVHTHDVRPHLYGTLAARLAGVRRVIHTRHGQIEDLSPRQRTMVRTAAYGTSHFVCVSHDACRLAQARGIPASRLRTIWNGIDVGRFAFRPQDQEGPIVTVARLNPEKDHGTLLRAMALLRDRGSDARLEIAGDGPCREELLQLSQQLGLQHRVRFLGNVQDVSALLARAGCFVLPSRTEGIALTILEAQSVGIPVIATAVGGNPEIIEHEVNGLLVPAADPPALAAAIQRMCQDPSLRCRLRQEARRRVEQHFDVRRMVREYEQLYRNA